jgi:hypothetical protein
VTLASRLRALGLFAAAGASALAGCTTTTTTTTFTPITGIEIRASTLLGAAGCGQGPDQVYRYAAALSFASGPDGGVAGAPVIQSGAPLTNIFECFTDGVFENLPTSDAGSLNFVVSIFAYTFDSYAAAGLPPSLGCPPLPDSGACTPSATPITAAQEGDATWTTLCTATQQSGTPVLAICGPLVPRGALATDAGAGEDAALDATTQQDATLDGSSVPADASASVDATAPPSDAQASDAQPGPADAGDAGD